MSHYEKFIVHPGPEFDRFSRFLCEGRVPLREKMYLIRASKSKKLDNCHYVVKKNTRNDMSLILNWRIHTDCEYIQLYWGHGILRLENNKHIRIIRPKYRIIFRCIARLIQLKKRAQVRVKTRQSFRVSGMFKRHIFAPASHRVFAYI